MHVSRKCDRRCYFQLIWLEFSFDRFFFLLHKTEKLHIMKVLITLYLHSLFFSIGQCLFRLLWLHNFSFYLYFYIKPILNPKKMNPGFLYPACSSSFLHVVSVFQSLYPSVFCPKLFNSALRECCVRCSGLTPYIAHMHHKTREAANQN